MRAEATSERPWLYADSTGSRLMYNAAIWCGVNNTLIISLTDEAKSPIDAREYAAWNFKMTLEADWDESTAPLVVASTATADEQGRVVVTLAAEDTDNTLVREKINNHEKIVCGFELKGFLGGDPENPEVSAHPDIIIQQDIDLRNQRVREGDAPPPSPVREFYDTVQIDAKFDDVWEGIDDVGDAVDSLGGTVASLSAAMGKKADVLTAGVVLAQFPGRFNILPPGFIVTVGTGGDFATLQAAYDAAANGFFSDVTFRLLPGTIASPVAGFTIYRHGVRIVAADAGDRPTLAHPLFWDGARNCTLDGVIIPTTNRRSEVKNYAQVLISNSDFIGTNTSNNGIHILTGSTLEITGSLFDSVGTGNVHGLYLDGQCELRLTSTTLRGWNRAISNINQSRVNIISGVVIENSGTIYSSDDSSVRVAANAITWLNTPETYSPAKNTTANYNSINVVR